MKRTQIFIQKEKPKTELSLRHSSTTIKTPNLQTTWTYLQKPALTTKLILTASGHKSKNTQWLPNDLDTNVWLLKTHVQKWTTNSTCYNHKCTCITQYHVHKCFYFWGPTSDHFFLKWISFPQMYYNSLLSHIKN